MNLSKNLVAFMVAILCSLFSFNTSLFAQTWVQLSNVSTTGHSIACSADGVTLVTLASSGIATSTNGGASWMTASVPGNQWRELACSGDGSVMIGISYPASEYADYFSTNSGQTWSPLTTIPGGEAWDAVAISADGKTWAMSCENDGLIYVSTNTGVSWITNNAPASGDWFSIAISANGKNLFAAQFGGSVEGYIYASSDCGNTWSQTGAPPSDWTSIACSADGIRLIAAGNDLVYTSTNSGTYWVPFNAPYASGNVVACSADGMKFIAGGRNLIATSNDGGTIWTSNNVPDQYWASVACSADGNKLFAISDPSLWALQITPTPCLNISGSPNNLALFWQVPSVKFVLEENYDLSDTNWVAVTNQPILNLTNLNSEVVVTPNANRAFYRLHSQ